MFRCWLKTLGVVACSLLITCSDLYASPDDLLPRLKQQLQSDQQLDARTRQRAVETVNENLSAPATAITEALAVVYPQYAAALARADGDDNAAVGALEPFARNDDLFLAADASFFLARTMMNQQRYEQSLPLLQKLTGEYAGHTAHKGDSQYYIGIAQAGMLENKAAIDSFMQFLQFNPDAAERLRVSAWRQVQELQAVKVGELIDVRQRMEFSRRRLNLAETDQATQQQQDQIIVMLSKLIKEEEKKEASSKGGTKNPNDQKKPSGQKSKQQAKNQPKKSNKGQSGSSNNANGVAEVRSYDDSPASPWSRLRNRSRDAANNAVKSKLPARYRDLVEKYTEAANGENN